MSKCIQLPGTTPGISLKDHVAKMLLEVPAMMEYYQLQASLHRCKYNALMKEGFTKQEALELCKLLS